MASYTLNLDRSQLTAVGMRKARTEVTRVTRRTLNRSAVLCPVDTGLLRSSGKMNVGPRGLAYVGEVVYDAEYAAAVHNGRRALTITARRPGGMLKFTIDGRTVYARRVHQPARAGRPFLATALREVATAAGFRVTIG
jgi:hypothetical protein